MVLGEVLGVALDEDTMGRLEDSGISIKDHEKVKDWIENSHMRLQSRAGAAFGASRTQFTAQCLCAHQRPYPFTKCRAGSGG